MDDTAISPDMNADLATVARRIRGMLIDMSYRGRTAHLGSAMSAVEILVALYWRVLRIDVAAPDDERRDRFILSKGHAATVLYSTLAARGFFPEDWLLEYAEPGARLSEHPIRGSAPGIEVTPLPADKAPS